MKLSHQDLASIIGSTRESVTVILGQLQAEGLLSLGRRKITIRDLSKLAETINVSPPRPAGEERRAVSAPRIAGNLLL